MKKVSLLDKNGVLIEPFDVLKVYHFTGARKKKYYMYKMAVIWKDKLYASHLNGPLIEPDYPLWTGFNNDNYEIIQSKNWEKLD